MNPEQKEKREEIIVGLQKMLRFLEANPEVPLPNCSEEQVIQFYSFMNLEKEDFVATAKAFGTFDKEVVGDKFVIRKTFGAVTLTGSIDRTKVCTKQTVKKLVEVEEWNCEPLLSQAEFEQIGQEVATV
jgi:hypothetical protein